MKNGMPPSALQAFLKGPSSRPPKGLESNFDNPSNRNNEALALIIVCIVLTTLATMARLYSCGFVERRLRVEDYFGLGAIIPFIAVTWSMLDYHRKVGFFVHQWDLRGTVLIDTGYNTYVLSLAYLLVILLLKTAILLEWNRIFVLRTTHNGLFRATTVLIIINIALTTSGFLTTLTGCIPPAKLWHFWLEGKCTNLKARHIFNATMNLAIDVFVLLLPLGIVWRLQMNRLRKWGVSVVFSVGLLTVVCATGRLYATLTLQYPDDLSKPYDATYYLSQMLLWMLSEVTCIVLVFVAPVLPRLVTESRIMSQSAATVASWVLPGKRSESTSSRSNTWPRATGKRFTMPHRKTDGLGTQGDSTELEFVTGEYGERNTADSERPSGSGLAGRIEYNPNAGTSDTSITPIVPHSYT